MAVDPQQLLQLLTHLASKEVPQCLLQLLQDKEALEARVKTLEKRLDASLEREALATEAHLKKVQEVVDKGYEDLKAAGAILQAKVDAAEAKVRAQEARLAEGARIIVSLETRVNEMEAHPDVKAAKLVEVEQKIAHLKRERNELIPFNKPKD